MSKLAIFEDSLNTKLMPLIFMRASCELKCGILSLLEKIIYEYEAVYGQQNICLGCRTHLVETVQARHQEAAVNVCKLDEPILLINGRILADANLPKNIPILGEDRIYMHGPHVVCARFSPKIMEKAIQLFATGTPPEQAFLAMKNEVNTTEVDVKIIEYPWQLIKENADEIKADYKRLYGKGKIKGEVHKTAVIYDKSNVVIEEGSEVEAYVVIDSRKGPVIIDKDARVQPHSIIQGPVYVGRKSTIVGDKIRGGTSIGPNCKVHGEVSNSIIHGYSNKAHAGFLGHSYLGKWVNLGAGTTNSNLKNNYGTVRVWNDGSMIDSKEQFLGCLIGDHAKTAVGTMLNTGTVISAFCNVFESPPPKYMKPFSFGEKHKYELEKAILTAKTVMARREIQMSEAEEKLIRELYV